MLRLSIGPAPFPFGFEFGAVGDEYPGGLLTAPNLTAPSDLCFSVTVAPN